MNNGKNNTQGMLPEPTLRRLPWYLAYVSLLHRQRVQYVSSTQISKELNVDASQIAKDLSFLNIRGKTRIGYDVPTLVSTLNDFLGFGQMHRAVVIGCGSLGGALMQDVGLAQYGLQIVAGFDVNPQLVGHDICGTPVYHIDDMPVQMRQCQATIAIVTVPVEAAQQAADAAIACGVDAIWNFTPSRIKVPEHIITANTSIYAHLAIIYNRINNK